MHAIKSQQRQTAQKDRGGISLHLSPFLFFSLSLFLPYTRRTFAGFRRGIGFRGHTRPAHGSKLRAAVTEQEPPPRREERARFAFILLCYLQHSSRPRTPRPLFHSGIITVQFPSASSMGEDCMLRGLRPVLLVLFLTASLLPSCSFSLSLVFFFLLSLLLHVSLSPAHLSERESFFVFFLHLSSVLISTSFSPSLLPRCLSVLAETHDSHVPRTCKNNFILPPPSPSTQDL